MKNTTIADRMLAHLQANGPTMVSPLLKAGGGGASAMTSLGRLYKANKVTRAGHHPANFVYGLPGQALPEIPRPTKWAAKVARAKELKAAKVAGTTAHLAPKEGAPPRMRIELRTASPFCIPPTEAQLARLKAEHEKAETSEEFEARGGRIQRLPTQWGKRK